MTGSRLTYHIGTDSNTLFFMAELYSVVYMCHIFFIQLSVNGHPDCFHVLAVVNSASMNIGVHMSFPIMVFQGHMPSRGISGSYGGFIPSFSRNLHSVFFTVISIYIPSNCASCFLFLHILTEFIVCRFFFFF